MGQDVIQLLEETGGGNVDDSVESVDVFAANVALLKSQTVDLIREES